MHISQDTIQDTRLKTNKLELWVETDSPKSTNRKNTTKALRFTKNIWWIPIDVLYAHSFKHVIESITRL